MIALWIVLAVVAFFVLLLLSSIHLKIRWEDALKVRVRFWFVSLDLLRPRASSKKKKQKKSPKKEKAPPTPSQGQKRSFSDWIGFLKFLLKLFKEVPREFVSRLRIRVKRLRLFVASPQPDQTALLYGAVCPLVYQVCEVANRFTKSEITYQNVGVYSDFCSQKIRGKVDIRLSLRVIDLLFIGARALLFLQELKFLKGGSDNERDPVETSH